MIGDMALTVRISTGCPPVSNGNKGVLWMARPVF